MPAGNNWGFNSGDGVLFIRKIREGLALVEKDQECEKCASICPVGAAVLHTLC